MTDSLHGVESGERGLSAYELAQQNGFTGTLTEWLESLRGPQGPTIVIYQEEINTAVAEYLAAHPLRCMHTSCTWTAPS